jgi:hypothetical protein
MTVGFIILLIFLVGLFAYVWFFAEKGWRTRLFNWLGAVGTVLWSGADIVFPALQGVNFDSVLTTFQAAVVGLIIQLGNAILREVTNTPPGKKD